MLVGPFKATKICFAKAQVDLRTVTKTCQVASISVSSPKTKSFYLLKSLNLVNPKSKVFKSPKIKLFIFLYFTI